MTMRVERMKMNLMGETFRVHGSWDEVAATEQEHLSIVNGHSGIAWPLFVVGIGGVVVGDVLTGAVELVDNDQPFGVCVLFEASHF
jgi:hypothetical protein